MIKKETIQSQGAPSEWPSLSPLNWKWLDDLRLLIQGREGRQNFINTLTDTKPNNANIRTFFVNDAQGDAYFTDNDGIADPYIGPDGELIVPGQIIAGSITTVGGGTAVSVYQATTQNIPDVTPTTLIFDTARFDDDAAMDLTTGIFTPLSAGKYQVTASVGFEGTNVYADKYVALGIAKNGVTLKASKTQTSVSADFTVLASGLFEMDGVTDYLEVAVEHNFGFATPTWGVGYTCYFDAVKVI